VFYVKDFTGVLLNAPEISQRVKRPWWLKGAKCNLDFKAPLVLQTQDAIAFYTTPWCDQPSRREKIQTKLSHTPLSTTFDLVVGRISSVTDLITARAANGVCKYWQIGVEAGE
jgi:hypothetical protein